jgi:PAS domain S-box-containing protein
MKKKHILIADDEADIALILKLQLEDAGYATDRARDGREAVELLRRKPYDLMLLDIKMPRLDGLQVLEEIKEQLQETAVVMMTAHGSEEIAVEAMKKGAIDYIAKPFSTDSLQKAVARALELSRIRKENLSLQRQLDDEREKMAAVLRGIPELLLAVDAKGRVMTVNDQAEALLGRGSDSMTGQPVAAVLSADIPPERLPCMTVLQTAEPCLDMGYNLLAGGRVIPVLSSATPLLDKQGQLVGCVEIIRDISALKALEQEKADFVSMLSHDLKSPITSIVGSLDLVREGRLGPVNDEQQEYLESAIESCAEMVEMIDTLLDIHRFDAGKMVLAIRKEDPGPTIQRTVSRFRSIARRNQLQFTTAIEETLPEVAMDRNKVTRTINNLLSNAAKFTPEGGTVEVGAEVIDEIGAISASIPPELYPREDIPATGRFLAITVRDSGIGIPAEALATIFDRFVQAKNRKKGKTRGTGLGLAFCRKVMDAHHGYIWAESEEGRGSTFYLLFPLE